MLILEEYQKLCIQLPDGNGGVLVPGRVPGTPDLPGIYPAPYPGQTPGQVPGLIPGQIPIHIPGQIPGPGQVPGPIPGPVPGQIPGQLPMQPPPPGMLLLSALFQVHTHKMKNVFSVDFSLNSL